MHPTIHLLTAAGFAAGAAQVAAQGMPGMPMPAQAASPAAANKLPLVEGEIRSLDPATGLVVLQHADIPNIAMPAMTMGYDVADKALLRGFKAGDKVRFQAALVHGKPTVVDIKPMK